MVTVPVARAITRARPSCRAVMLATPESLTRHTSTVESARSATKVTESPTVTVSTAGRMPKAAAFCRVGELESVHATAIRSSAAQVCRLTGGRTCRFHTDLRGAVNPCDDFWGAATRAVIAHLFVGSAESGG